MTVKVLNFFFWMMDLRIVLLNCWKKQHINFYNLILRFRNLLTSFFGFFNFLYYYGPYYLYRPIYLIMKSSEKLCWVYITAGSIEEAKNIGQKLVEQNLAACVNLLENMISIYKWEDKLEEGQEVVMIAKTRKILMPKLIETVNSLHSYDCACILELPIQGGNPEFLSWIETKTEVTEEK